MCRSGGKKKIFKKRKFFIASKFVSFFILQPESFFWFASLKFDSNSSTFLCSGSMVENSKTLFEWEIICDQVKLMIGLNSKKKVRCSSISICFLTESNGKCRVKVHRQCSEIKFSTSVRPKGFPSIHQWPNGKEKVRRKSAIRSTDRVRSNLWRVLVVRDTLRWQISNRKRRASHRVLLVD